MNILALKSHLETWSLWMVVTEFMSGSHEKQQGGKIKAYLLYALKCRSLSSVHLCGLPTKTVPLYLCFDIPFPPKMDYTAVYRLCIVRCNDDSQLGVTGHTLCPQGTSANVWRRFSLEHSGGLLPSSGERSEVLLNMQKCRRQPSPPPSAGS